MAWFLLLLLTVWRTGSSIDVDMGDRDWDWGSGLHDLLHSFPAHSPFVTETPEHAANCTQRFWLPPSTPVCWENIAGPEEFEETRLLVLQNRAALHAVTEASGLEEGGVSYEQQAIVDVQGVREDHLSISQTVESMQKVFLDLDAKRKEGDEHDTLIASLQEQIANTMNIINGREEMAALLEQHLSKLERTLNAIQHRLTRLLNQ
ncbi:hypothetical protein KOW79_019466 [Hemibagrus wyckioides]|uniref:Uncharacterized protein n=1 Tax=Hemibagrus wyckioides TaxID=337641 RepID=A0A9D3N6C1_9TELE|nr:uncharacterized protein si:ch211-57n23.1 [Hemibagrus wyckioides]KAG7317168.1 hypothetical protein KOW79_019466 [Hemibagrus wyckioides]